MKTLFKQLLASTVLFMALHSDYAIAEECRAAIAPDPRMQALFDQILAQESREVASRYITELKSLSSDGGADIVPQLFLYQLHNRRDERKVLGALGILGDMWQDIAPESLVRVLLPCLESDNTWLHKRARNALDESFYDQEKGTYDSRAIEPVFLEQKRNIPKGIVDYMFSREPRAAVLSMARVYGDNVVEADIANILSGEPMAALHTLAERSEWWAHLYVASILEKDPLLRTPERMDILVKDTHPIVQEKVSKLIEEMAPKPEALPTLE